MCYALFRGNGTQGIHLVFHQGNEWGYHNGSTILHQGWQLIAKRFSSPSWHDYKRIAPSQHAFNDFFLQPFEGCKSEIFFKGGKQISLAHTSLYFIL